MNGKETKPRATKPRPVAVLDTDGLEDVEILIGEEDIEFCTEEE